jgi:hypothetical protein
MLGPDFFPGLVSTVLQHQLNAECAAAAAEDPVLARVLDGPLVNVGHTGVIHSREMVAFDLISAAGVRLITLREPFNEEALVREVAHNLEQTRQGLRGQEISTLVAVGLMNLHLSEGTVLTTPWGRVVPASDRLSVVEPFGYRANSVLLVPARRRVVVLGQGAEWPASEPPVTAPDATARLLFPLAVLLATDVQPRTVPSVAWISELTPLRSPSGASSPRYVARLGQPEPRFLSHDECASIEKWSQRLAESYDPAIEIAVRRTISAVAERDDPQDGLIDAVMAWENLFGASTETTFRVTAALAHVIEPDRVKRVARRRALARTYAARSRLVHGAQLDSADVAARREEATEAAISALRGLFLRFPRLIARYSSEDRSNLLLLGAVASD